MRKILIFILCLCTIFLCFSIPSFANESVTSRAVPTDLTGYTVSVPSGWTASSLYGNYIVNFIELTTGFSYEEIYLGFDIEEGMGSANSIIFASSSSPFLSVSPSNSFTISFTGGIDASNQTLIQWFVNNNAIFRGPTDTSSIPVGPYHFKEFDFLDIPNAGWSDGTGYTYSYSVSGKYVTTSRTLPFTALNLTFDEYVSSSHYTVTFSVDTRDGILNLATYSASYGNIVLEQREDFKYIVFDEQLIGSADDIEFIRQFLLSGFPDIDTSPTDNPWLYILEMIIEALKVDLFGYFSIWDIFTTIAGIFIVTWLLKLLAGG